MDILLHKYPEFLNIPYEREKELVLLLNFRNFMKVCTTAFPTAKFQKAHFLDIVTRLSEGHHMRYVTGSGAKAATERRVLIYERETGI